MSKRGKPGLVALRRANDLARERIRALWLANAEAAARRATGRFGRSGTRTVVPMGRYASATRTRVRTGPRPGGGAAAAHLSPVRSVISRECQDLDRNSLIGRIVLRRMQDLLAGDGAILEVTTPRDDSKEADGWCEEATRLLDLFADAGDSDLTGHPDLARRQTRWEQDRTIVKAWGTDGDILAILTKAGSVQLVESARVVSPAGKDNALLPGGGSLVDGVRMDRFGAAVEYYVADWDRHGALRMAEASPRDAAWCDLLVNPFDGKPNLVRGEPAVQAIIERIDRLDKYIEDTGLAAEVALLFGGLVKSKDPALKQAMLEESSEDPDEERRRTGTGPRLAELSPAALHYIYTDEDIVQMKPEHPHTNYREYVLTELMLISAELGLPIAATIFDAAGLSWSQLKGLLSICMRCMGIGQARLARFNRRVCAWKLAEFIRRGLLPARDDWAVDAVMPPAPVTSFKEEVEGLVLAINNNLMHEDQAVQRMGNGRYKTIIAKRRKNRLLAAAAGVLPVMAPGAKPAGTEKDRTNADDSGD